ncbi:3-carboxy-cis,cis-muconate cycloisomerase [Bordetella hinzii]|uniref:3-carboxy-cis,cis-muconate cycloisomerase n=1 Tax=Bordetella hinzii TaxID=103855 RepID=UPI002A189A6B|nr:3-carboxy-cis,cis-muconate cycloisomerase [Bordetella hinzii]WPL79299.1 3-carboxy-cis,cis-muconate cycloisomerase [Bordetella hinzii]
MNDLTDRLRGAPDMLALWDGAATLRAMLRVEAGLARACAAQGVIPASAVPAIERACQAAALDTEALKEAAALAGNLAIPLVKQLTAAVAREDAEAARYVHWGATSQDIIDSAMLLQLRAAFDGIDAGLRALAAALARQARLHRDTVMAGRSWMQQALPVTLGLKLAQALDAVERHRQRLAEVRVRVLCLQFGGAAGTLASLGAQAPGVAAALAGDLGLPLPAVPWHTQRDRIAEAGALMGLIIGSLGKLARDISLQAQTEVGELREPAAPGKGGSSTMPHKRNPVGCAAILSAAIRAPQLVATLLSAMVQEHERALGGWQAEWDTLPELVILASGCLSNATQVIAGLEVDAARMRRNLASGGDQMMAEAVMLALGAQAGRLQAHGWVEEAVRQAEARGLPLLDVLAADPRIAQYLSRPRLAELLAPDHYTGQSQAFVDAVLATSSSGKTHG